MKHGTEPSIPTTAPVDSDQREPMTDGRLEWFRINTDHGVRLSAELGEELLDEIGRLRGRVRELEEALALADAELEERR